MDLPQHRFTLMCHYMGSYKILSSEIKALSVQTAGGMRGTPEALPISSAETLLFPAMRE